jgi:hypothetical protein
MSAWFCFLWWILFGALLGWLACWLLGRSPRREVEIVEKTVEKMVDNPQHLSRIRELEAEVAAIPGMRSQIQQFQSAPPAAPRTVEKVVEKVVIDTKGIEERDRKLQDLQRRHDDLNAEVLRFRRGPDIDLLAARSAGFTIKSVDELEIIEGIGPKIAELLRASGVTTFMALANMLPAQIQDILDKGGGNFKLARPDTWPEQADLAAHNRWQALKALQQVLVAGNR